MSKMKRKLQRQYWQDSTNRRNLKKGFKLFVNTPTGIEGLLYMKKIMGDQPLQARPLPVAADSFNMLADIGLAVREQERNA